jgi:hypothetical protein
MIAFRSMGVEPEPEPEPETEAADVLASMGLSEEEATAAAQKIQAIQRGKLARRELAAQYGAPTESEPDDEGAEVSGILSRMGVSPEEATAAALKIQAIQRGKLERRQLAVGDAGQPELAALPGVALRVPAPDPGDPAGSADAAALLTKLGLPEQEQEAESAPELAEFPGVALRVPAPNLDDPAGSADAEALLSKLGLPEQE